MIDVIDLIKQKKMVEINSSLMHQNVIKSIHQVSKDEISRTAATLTLISQHLKTKKQEKQPKDITLVYLVF